LADEIARHGAVVSALPMDTPPDAANFPPRNRIIIGMSLGVIIIEAGKRSGALISARLANEYNREAFALPGLITNPYAHGTNALIRDGGAKLITCLDDVLDELGEAGRLMKPAESASLPEEESLFSTSSDGGTQRPETSLEDVESAVYNALGALGADDTALDRVIRDSGVAPQLVAAALTKLQMKGYVRQAPGNYFAKKR
jgi:DNA processing protein